MTYVCANVAIETYGCSANQNNSEIMAGLLEKAGFAVINVKDKNFSWSCLADVVILNTCVVKGPTLKRMERRLMDLLLNDKKVVVAGCMGKVYRERIEKIKKEIEKIKNKRVNLIVVDEIKHIVGAVSHLQNLQNLKTKTENKSNIQKDFVILTKYKKRINKVIGIHQIATGCLSNCSFCVTKIAKGYLKSFDEDGIVKNIEQDIKEGCKEIWLTATDVSCYGLDNGKYMLVSLLNKISSIKGKFFVRIGMLNPGHVINYIDELLAIYEDQKIFKFIHLPLQSASDKVLKEMKRNYSKKDFIEIAKKFKQKFPQGTLATDIITGFYNEDEDDFNETIELVKHIQPDIINISRFWPMPKTTAYIKWANMEKEKREKIMEIAKIRSKILYDLHNKISLEKNKLFLNKEAEVLIDKKENFYEARDINYRLFLLDSGKLGDFCKVKVYAIKSNCLLAKQKK